MSGSGGPVRAVRSLRRARLVGWLPLGILVGAVLSLAVLGAVLVSAPKERPAVVAVPDVAAKEQVSGFASLCARLFMTWDSRRPDIFEKGLRSCQGEGDLSSGLGFEVPDRGFQDVYWVQPVQVQEVSGTDSLVTVAVKTQRPDLRFVVFPVRRYPGRGVGLSGYPAFVGAPTVVGATGDEGDGVDDPGLETVVNRVLANYLAGDADNLRSDLVAGTAVRFPSEKFTVEGEEAESQVWIEPGEFVAAVVLVRGEKGEVYKLRYELKVAREGNRWFVSRIQVSPDQMEGVPS